MASWNDILKNIYENKKSADEIRWNSLLEISKKRKSSAKAATQCPEYRAKISESSKKMWEDPDYRLKMSKKRKCYTPIVGPDGFIYPSVGIAAQILGIPRTAIPTAIKNNKPYKGMTFSYLN